MDGLAAMRSRRGRRTYLMAAVFGLMLCLMVAMAFSLALIQEYVGAACGLLVALVCFHVVAMVATIRIEVDRERLSCSHLYANQRLAWDDVTALRVMPTRYGLANLLVSTTSGHHLLQIWAVGNYRELATAILRHAEAANPVVQVRGEASL